MIYIGSVLDLCPLLKQPHTNGLLALTIKDRCTSQTFIRRFFDTMVQSLRPTPTPFFLLWWFDDKGLLHQLYFL